MFGERKGDGVVVPFLMLGDPSPDIALEAVGALVEAGADALELGIPFSDPIADGPVIQRAAERALAAGVTPGRCFELIADIRTRHPSLPLGLLAYANVVVRRGIPEFYQAAADAGADSVLIADAPAVECGPFVAAARSAGIAPVVVAPPGAGVSLVNLLAELGGGYTYLQGRPGVTGDGVPMTAPDRELITRLAAAGAPPPLVGFGVSRRAHVEAALRAGAHGVIVGSALVAIVGRLVADPGAMCLALTEAVSALRRPSAAGV